MQILIDINEEDYNFIKEVDESNYSVTTNLYKAVYEGIILPKGHGRLIDETEANGLIAEGKDGDKAYFGTVNKDWEVIDFLKTVPTIIEADKESEG